MSDIKCPLQKKKTLAPCAIVQWRVREPSILSWGSLGSCLYVALLYGDYADMGYNLSTCGVKGWIGVQAPSGDHMLRPDKIRLKEKPRLPEN